MLYPPEHFDLNEWFTIISAAFAVSVAMLLPKRFSPVTVTVIVVLTVFVSQTVDHLISVEPYDFYDMGDSSKYEIMDVINYFVSYPPVTYIFLYFYDKWRLRGVKRIVYVIGYTFVTVLLEWLAYKCHVYTYKGWHTWYSIFVYLPVYTLDILMFHLTRHLLHSEKRA